MRVHGCRDRWRPAIALPVATVLLAVLYQMARTSWVSGDGAVYAAAVRSVDFWTRPIHFAYYVFGWALTRVFSPLHLRLEDVLVLGNAVLSAAAVVTFAVWARGLGASLRETLLSAGILAASGNIIHQATGVEVYALELFFLVLALVALTRHRPFWAGIACGGALLVTPLASMAVGYLVWAAIRERRVRTFVQAAVPAVLLIGVLLAVCWQPYLFGQRGLINTGEARVMSPACLAYNAFALLKNFIFAVFFLPFGLWISWRRRDGLTWLLGLLLVMHIPVLLGMREDGVFLLPLYPLLALLMGRGLDAVASRLGRGAGPALAVFAILQVSACLYVWVDNLPDRRREDFCQMLTVCPPGSVLVGSWDQRMAAAYYAPMLAPAHPTYGAFQDEEGLIPADFRELLANRGVVYVLEDYYPSRAPRDLLPVVWRERLRNRHSLVARLRRMAPQSRSERLPVGSGALELYRFSAR